MIWRIIMGRRVLVLSILVVALVVGVIMALQPHIYLAKGALQVRSGASNAYKLQESLNMNMDADDRIESEVTILQSNNLYARVAEQLNLQGEPAILGKKANSKYSMDDPYVQAAVVSKMRQLIKVERTPKTQIISISCTATSPLLASKIVSTLMNDYIQHIFESRFSSSQRAAKFLVAQLDDLKNQILDDQQKLVDLQGKLGVIGFDDSHNLITAQIEDLAHANEEAGVERIIAEARYRVLQDEPANLIDGGPPMLSAANAPPVTGSLLQNLRSSQADVAARYANVKEQFGSNYPETKRLKSQLDETTKAVEQEQSRVVAQAKVAYEAAQRNLNMTSSVLNEEKNKAFQKRNDMVNYQILLHEYQASRTLYEGLTQRLREAGIEAGLESAEIEVVDLPALPIAPTGYGPITLVCISLGLGVIVAFIAAMVANSTDTSIHSVDDLEKYIDVPALAVLPNYTASAKKTFGYGASNRARNAIAASAGPSNAPPIEVLESPISIFTEGIRTLRSGVLLVRADRPPRTILVTSALPQEGKSTVCGNLACIFAQAGARVVLVDLDLRRPSQHSKFRLPNTSGVSNILTGSKNIEECIRTIVGVPSLHIITSGPIPPSPGTLLTSSSMLNFLRQLSEAYDYVIIDSPPSLTVSDSGTLSSLVDCVVLVVRNGIANKKIVRRVYTTLVRLGAKIPGFVFNGVDKSSMEYYEYKGHYYYKDYGYSERQSET